MAFTSDLQLGPLIGGGSFGDVFCGADSLHGQVAVKAVRRRAGETDAQFEARKDELMGEAKHLKAAEHANVVRVLNLLRRPVAHDHLHIVTEFCSGGSLQDLVAAGPVPLSRVRTIASDVAAGLFHIHSKGLIHRDIKPGNILCSAGCWKIADFGLVSDHDVLGYASACGYRNHLAPEFYDRQITSVKTDVWAFGMTIYRVMHGKAFYDDLVLPLDIRASVQAGGFAHSIPWLAHVPKPWRSFIRKAMCDDSARRYQNAHELRQAIGGLPLSDWECSYSTARTEWRRSRGSRRIEVVLESPSPKKNTWIARSVGGLRDRVLARSAGDMGRADAEAQLAAFFRQA